MTTSGDHGTAEQTARPSNRLIDETSPYLLQHAHNPVDWYPWGPAALQRARLEDKPILLSIGYAACHWCHVMERESFEDPSIAALMNEHFVCIKVDREERPDLDDIYMSATVAMTGAGGWPMTVFATPDQEPFFAGTYFPPVDKFGRPGFPTLLRRIAEAWATQRDDLVAQASELTEHLRGQSRAAAQAPVSLEWIVQAVTQLGHSYDPRYGGFGTAPKFPPSPALRLLALYHVQTSNIEALDMLTGTLDGMKNGGMYDHIAGGFCRYSTDERWLVPHFEKMLYDNAQLSRVYLEAFQITQDAEYARIVRETLDYILREMQAAEGGYYSATDADSEGVEGKFAVWTPAEVRTATAELSLSEALISGFCHYFDVTQQGNWEGHSIPNTPLSLASAAEAAGVSEQALAAAIEPIKRALYAARRQRVQPLLDDKILTSWNGLMLGSMAEGYRVLGDERYLESAQRAASFLLSALRRPDGGLFRTAKLVSAGSAAAPGAGQYRAHLDGYLEDYAFLADGLLDLVEAGGPQALLGSALELAERMLSDFGDEPGALFNTARQHEQLIVRTREGQDGAIPSANAVAARVLARLARHLNRSDLASRAEDALSAHSQLIQRAPRGFATSLHAADFLSRPPPQLCFAGSLEQSASLRSAASAVFLPQRVIAYARSAEPGDAPPLAVGKPTDQAALFVCRDFSCQAPVLDPEAVGPALREAVGQSYGAARPRVGATQVAGRASAAATQAFAAAHQETLPHGYIDLPIADPALRVSRLGFGGYRVDQGAPAHRAALLHAVERGINLIDTSTNYTSGHSEQLIGEALSQLATSDPSVPREAIVVVSKVGYVQGPNLALARQRAADGAGFAEMVEYSEDCWHCIHPEWIEEQLSGSLERLRLTSLDVYLLHNPEYFFSRAVEADGRPTAARLEALRGQFYARVQGAFEQLEREVKRGRITSYGVSSNSLVRPAADPEATDLSRMLSAAGAAAESVWSDERRHHFRVVQLPANLLEAGALLEQNHPGPTSALAFAEQHGLCVLVNRPLNAITDAGLVRLAAPAQAILEAKCLPLPQAQSRVQSLEEEYRRNLAPDLRAPQGSKLSPATFFDWGRRLGKLHAAHAASALRNLQQWEDIEERVVARETGRYLAALDGAFSGPQAAVWREWRARYVRALDEYLSALRKLAANASQAQQAALVAALDAAEPDPRPLSQRALRTLLGAAGVSCVLVGMRRPEYVDDALQVLSVAPSARAQSVLQRTSSVR